MAAETETTAASSSTFDEDVKKLMGKGKVHLVCNENLDAVKCFEEATKKLDDKYGQAADECGEAYFYYGKSLLEVARMEGGVLGNALQGAIDTEVQENGDGEKSDKANEDGKKMEEDKTTEENNKTDEDKKTDEKDEKTTEDKEKKDKDLFVGPDIDKMDEEEKEKIGKEVTDAMTEEAFKEAIQEDAKEKDGKPSEKKEDETPEETKEPEKSTTEEDEKPEETKPAEKEEASEDKKDEEEEQGESAADEEEEGGDEEGEEAEPMEGDGAEDAEAEQPEEEEPTYMELAWQMLEVARITFQKRESKEGQLMLAQCHLKLGEIQMEQEQFLSAVEDFLKCLDIQKEHLEPDNRLLAETAYNIGLAFSFQSMHEKSRDYYSKALESIDLRIKNLQKSIEEAESKSKGKEKATDDNPFVANRKELQELQELYPEIKAKVDDASEMMKQADKKPDVSSIMGNGSSTTIGFGHSCDKEAPVTMIATKKAPVAATDISHLVHRNKRKPDEASEDNTAAKKPRQDPETSEPNGKQADATNGKTKTSMEATPAES